ncbi:Pex19-domain-containing protein [Leucogyrophana mollusca]|uniref:Pex19-domain-containing protein n=1 Tax=Leucogyrophana mollusca TaxID=85980 RepID=A0ACB8BIZ1_9AGAM|nr:Pex19-domain-containing protein [Leucogyrophana mollusca]
MPDNTKPHIDEDEDLDDLDDVLDQFSPAQALPAASPVPPPPPPAGTSAGSAKSPIPPSSSTAGPDLPPDFASELARGMENLMREMGGDFSVGGLTDDPSTGGKDETPQEREERERAFAAAWEAMLIEGMDGMVDPALRSGTSAASPPPPGADRDGYQARVRAAMSKLKESESTLKSTSAESASAGADPLEALLAQLGDLGGEGEESEEGLQGMLEMMMGQLMSKDVLYEPLKELSDKFPDYLATHAATLSAQDKTRYDAQIVCIRRLLEVFEAKDFKDEDEQAKEKIVELMGELQAHGSPPEEIMGPLPPGFNMGADGLPNVPDNCIIS